MELSVPVMIYAYWAFAFLVGILFFKKDILTFNTEFDTRRITLLAASLLIVAINAWVYSHSTTDGGRKLDILTVLVFTIGNGIAETFMFYAVFASEPRLPANSHKTHGRSSSPVLSVSWSTAA